MVATAEAVAQRFGPEYWREHDENEAYPEAFVSALGEHGFFGVTVPEALGGSGQGLSELVLVMEALCRGGGGGGPALGYLVDSHGVGFTLWTMVAIFAPMLLVVVLPLLSRIRREQRENENPVIEVTALEEDCDSVAA